MKKRETPPEIPLRDSFFHGKVTLFQYRRGYRFAVDAPILADFLPESQEAALEIGCGCGVISLLALQQNRFLCATVLEIQPRLAELAGRNARENGMAKRLHVRCVDFNAVYGEYHGQTLVFSNPPFERVGQGKLSANEELRIAKFEVKLTLREVIEKSAGILAPSGSLCLIFPYARYGEASEAAAASGLFPLRLKPVRPFADAPADRILVEWKKEAAIANELPALVIFRERGVYSEEMERILSGEPHGGLSDRRVR